MKISYSNGRLEARDCYPQRELLKTKGWRWDWNAKCWWTSDVACGEGIVSEAELQILRDDSARGGAVVDTGTSEIEPVITHNQCQCCDKIVSEDSTACEWCGAGFVCNRDFMSAKGWASANGLLRELGQHGSEMGLITDTQFFDLVDRKFDKTETVKDFLKKV